MHSDWEVRVIVPKTMPPWSYSGKTYVRGFPVTERLLRYWAHPTYNNFLAFAEWLDWRDVRLLGWIVPSWVPWSPKMEAQVVRVSDLLGV